MEPGECLLVVGPSGSGKSTLALAIAGLVPRELPGEWSGRLLVDGLETSVAPPAELAARVGLVFQDPESQLVMDRAEDDVAFGLENRGWAPAAMHLAVPQALAAVGLGGLGRRRSVALSGGQQQRLALAGALAPRPGILVLDEPTANLDPDGARAFAERLDRLRAAQAATIVLIEHRVELAWPLADRVLALGSDGRPIDWGRPDEVLARSGARLAAAGVWLPVEPGGGARPGPAPVAPRPVAGVAHAQALTFGYEPSRPVIHDVELRLAAGERVALLGSNGSGKSTLARLLVGLLRPSGGRVSLAGADPVTLAPADLARRAGFVFQDPEQQFLAGRVEAEVMLGLRPAERPAAAEMLDRLGLPLERFGERSPYALSGGEQRRLSLACALARRPRLLVLDEPTFGQDRHGHEGLLAILRERVEDGVCVLAATHDERFVAGFARRVVRLEDGRVVADGPVGGPLDRPIAAAAGEGAG
ncbi:MAG: ATP-binding cassette domain-containing protein [Chloroflexi bacterium]|nr:ATP-binding cassette domain-containing protein [Chloroflexota bacterium]